MSKQRKEFSMDSAVVRKFEEQVPHGRQGKKVEMLIRKHVLDEDVDEHSILPDFYDRLDLTYKQYLTLQVLFDMLPDDAAEQHPKFVTVTEKLTEHYRVYQRADHANTTLMQFRRSDDIPFTFERDPERNGDNKRRLAVEPFQCHCGEQISPRHLLKDMEGVGNCIHCGFQWIDLTDIMGDDVIQ